MTGQDTEVRGARRHTAARAAAAARTAAASPVTARAVARAAAVAAVIAVLAGCSAGSAPAAKTTVTARAATSPVSATHAAPPGPGRPPGGTPVMQSASVSPSSSPSALPVAPPGAASLPQTSVLPRTDDTAFGNAVHDIWLAVTTGDPDDALPAFFPEKAYLQVKAIPDPSADWDERLWYDFTLDVAAAHKLVPSDATLVKVIVAAQYTQWVGVGACYNDVGYWHAPGARVVYLAGGVTRSFGIASFISWRGDWYLVHLGAVVRSGAYGIVDDPEEGDGVPGPPGGC